MKAAATYPRGLAIGVGAQPHGEGCEHCECSTLLGDRGQKDAFLPVESTPRSDGCRDSSFFGSDALKDFL